MAGLFVSASTQYVKNAGAVVPSAYPCTLAAWIYPTTTSAVRSMVSICASVGVNKQYLEIRQTSSNTWNATADDGTTNAGAGAGTITINQWAFAVARFISSISRRIDVFQFDGSTVSANNTTSVGFPASLDTIAIGARVTSTVNLAFDGSVAEFWYADIDVQPGGAALEASYVRELAVMGPLAFANLAPGIIQYRSLRKALTSDRDEGSEYYCRGGTPSWTQSGSPTVGPHCALPYWYVKPGQDKVVLTI